MPVTDIKRRFTLWYIRRGYTFDYDFSNVPIYADDYIAIPGQLPTAIWGCPWWVKPLLIFFSPSVYAIESWCKPFVDAFMKGVEEGMKQEAELRATVGDS